jgi:hypothetical protein
MSRTRMPPPPAPAPPSGDGTRRAAAAIASIPPPDGGGLGWVVYHPRADFAAGGPRVPPLAVGRDVSEIPAHTLGRRPVIRTDTHQTQTRVAILPFDFDPPGRSRWGFRANRSGGCCRRKAGLFPRLRHQLVLPRNRNPRCAVVSFGTSHFPCSSDVSLLQLLPRNAAFRRPPSSYYSSYSRNHRFARPARVSPPDPCRHGILRFLFSSTAVRWSASVVWFAPAHSVPCISAGL